jgi:hypothetical protein
MKNSEIHKNLSGALIRDYLSLTLIKIFEREICNKREYIQFDENSIQWAVNDCEKEIEFHQRRLELLKEKLAIITLMKLNGWQDFDVSNWTQNDINHKLHMTFIGTQEEYDNLTFEYKQLI